METFWEKCLQVVGDFLASASRAFGESSKSIKDLVGNAYRSGEACCEVPKKGDPLGLFSTMYLEVPIGCVVKSKNPQEKALSH